MSSLAWKMRLARLMRWPFMKRLIVWGIRLTVPRHRLGVGVVALDDEGRVLMLRHVFHPDVPWGLPGGWLNRHEEPMQGALRELREETGLMGTDALPLLVKGDDQPHHVEIIYQVHVQPGPMQLSGEILEAAWVAVDELPFPLHDSVRLAIATAVAKRNN